MAHDPNDIPKDEKDLSKLTFAQIKKNFDRAMESSELPQKSDSELIGLSGLMLGMLAFLIVAMLVGMGMKAVRSVFPGSSKDKDEATYQFFEILGLFIVAFVLVLIFIYVVTIT